jgi:hypothetical protein
MIRCHFTLRFTERRKLSATSHEDVLGSRSIAPRTHNIGTRTQDRKLSGHRRRSWRGHEEKKSHQSPCRKLNAPAIQPIAQSLYWLSYPDATTGVRCLKYHVSVSRNRISLIMIIKGRSQWPRGLRHVQSSAARTLDSWVRIPLEAWMYVHVFLCCVVLCR